jgi:hypothetical protein
MIHSGFHQWVAPSTLCTLCILVRVFSSFAMVHTFSGVVHTIFGVIHTQYKVYSHQNSAVKTVLAASLYSSFLQKFAGC